MKETHSEKPRYAVGLAANVARDLQKLLAPACTKIRIVGSLGRCDPEHPRNWPDDVGDIELLCLPTASPIAKSAGSDGSSTVAPADEKFELCAKIVHKGNREQPLDCLESRLANLLRCDAIAFDPALKRNGSRYKRVLFRGIPVDLFIVRPPADWGVLCAIRTGPREWSHAMVKQREFGGLLPAGLRVKDGQLLITAPGILSKRPCAEEGHFFQALGLPFVPPYERTLSRLQQVLAEVPRGETSRRF